MAEGQETKVAGGGSERRWGRRLLIGGVAALAVAGIGVGVVAAKGGGWHHGGMHDFAQWRLERALDAVDATAEQKARIEAIAEATFDELAPGMATWRDTRGELAALLAAPEIDAAAVERLRAARVAAIDAASKRVATSLVEAAEVLEPAQRAALAKQLEKRGGWRGRGRDD